jgi:hypothetical protein
MIADLAVVLTDGDLRLEPFTDAHVEGLRAACAEDREIWPIYPVSMVDEHFDPSLARVRDLPNWICSLCWMATGSPG